MPEASAGRILLECGSGIIEGRARGVKASPPSACWRGTAGDASPSNQAPAFSKVSPLGVMPGSACMHHAVAFAAWRIESRRPF
jgi:hypothetical protein